MTVFDHLFLTAKSTSSTDAERLWHGNYDAGLFVPSWDSRCLAVTKTPHLRIDNSLTILFSGKDAEGRRDSNERILSSWLRSWSADLSEVTGASSNLDSVFEEAVTWLAEVWAKKGRPIRLLIDFSTCPRYYALGLLAMGLKNGILSSATILYSEGQYKSIQGDGNFKGSPEILTRGRWETVSIPFLNGEVDPGKDKYFLMSVGFEGAKTMRVVEREDPDRISILLPKPGVLPGYDEIARIRNRELIECYAVPPKEIVHAPAGDAVRTWANLTRRKLERVERENAYYLCFGPKPHALALALRALTLGYPTVVYKVPEAYRHAEVVSTGKFWRYDIEDRTALIPFVADDTKLSEEG